MLLNIKRNLIDTIKHFVALVAVAGLLLPAYVTPANAVTTRIKDIVQIEGVRDNMLVGYGLVVGLNGTGDSMGNSPFTEQSLIGMLERLGVNIRGENLNTDNVAAVMVTATLPPFSRQGSRIDVATSALGDAQSLMGGILLVTPLMGADGEVYAVAQGPVATASIDAGGDGGSVTRGVPTGGRIANGAIIEREINFDLNGLDNLHLALRNPDFTTAVSVRDAINDHMGMNIARANDPGTIDLNIPAQYRLDVVSLVTEIEQLLVSVDQTAKVVIDESSGIIVMGEDVRISTVAIAQGNLTIRISEDAAVSQPNSFAPNSAQTVTVPNTSIAIDSDTDSRLAVVEEGVSLQELVSSLNALGVGPRDVITILQAIKSAGALQAEIEVM